MSARFQRTALWTALVVGSLLAASCATTVRREVVHPGAYREFVIDDLLVSLAHVPRATVAENVGQSFYLQVPAGTSIRVFCDDVLLTRLFAEEESQIEISPTGDIFENDEVMAEDATRVVVEEPGIYREVEGRARLDLTLIADALFDCDSWFGDADDDYYDYDDDSGGGSHIEPADVKPVPASKTSRSKR